MWWNDKMKKPAEATSLPLSAEPWKIAEKLCAEGLLNTGADQACSVDEIRTGEDAAIQRTAEVIESFYAAARAGEKS